MPDLTEETTATVATAPATAWDGPELARAMQAASVWLDRHAASINALNVFPVPDGDTGTNMTLTLQAACKHGLECGSQSASEVTARLAHGALMGARGNSGVIFSQVLRGFQRGVAGADAIGAHEWAAGMREAATSAYQAVLKPVEGTMLTVVRDMAEGAAAAAEQDLTLIDVLAQTVTAGKESVARTPTLLQKLRDAGVVDAGGEGLFVIFEGLLRHAKGEPVAGAAIGSSAGVLDLAPDGVHVAHGEYGYCTNFIVMGEGMDFPQVREWIASKGDSAVIVGDDRAIKVHIHTGNPGEILSYVTPLGSLRQVAITDMQEQHEDFLDLHEQAGTRGSAPADDGTPVSGIATVAVVSGKGLASAFRSMGATALVEGGQTMNPSTQDLLRAIEALPQESVILLPNNGNIVMAAKQAAELSHKQVAVVPTDTLPQGMAALVAFNYDAALEANVQAMQAAADLVETGEVTTAVRDANLDGVAVKTGDVIGLHNGKLVVAGTRPDDVAVELLDRMGAAGRELITLYYGGDVTEAQAAPLCARVQEMYPEATVEVVAGGQPFYAYIIAVE